MTSKQSSAPNKSRWMLIGSAVAVVAIASALFLSKDKPTTPSPVVNMAPPHSNEEESHAPVLADKWDQSQLRDAQNVVSQAFKVNENERTEKDEKTSFGMSTLLVHQAIGQVRIDDNGIILDKDTQILLENAFRKLGPEMSVDDLEELRQIIVTGLPDPYGEQASDILNNYYLYKLAEANLLADRESTSAENSEPRNATEDFEALVRMRRENLGSEVATKLFLPEEVYSRYLLQRQQAETDSQLTEEQRSERMGQLRQDLGAGYLQFDQRKVAGEIDALKESLQELNEQSSAEFSNEIRQIGLMAIATVNAVDEGSAREDWQTRMNEFSTERNGILSAALSEADKLAQLNTLLEQKFSAYELNIARQSVLE